MFIGTGDLVVRYVDPTGSSLCISKVLAISLTLARVLLKPYLALWGLCWGHARGGLLMHWMCCFLKRMSLLHQSSWTGFRKAMATWTLSRSGSLGIKRNIASTGCLGGAKVLAQQLALRHGLRLSLLCSGQPWFCIRRDCLWGNPNKARPLWLLLARPRARIRGPW